MKDINIADTYKFEQLFRDGAMDDISVKNLRKICNLGIEDKFMDFFFDHNESWRTLYSEAEHKAGEVYAEEDCFSKDDFESLLMDITDFDEFFEETGITREEFENASTEMPPHNDREIILYENRAADDLGDFFAVPEAASVQYGQICRMGLADDLASTLIMYVGDRCSADGSGIGEADGPHIRYMSPDDHMAENAVVKVNVAADLMVHDLENSLLYEARMSKVEFENEIPGLTDVMSAVCVFNGEDPSVESINNLYSGHFDPNHIFVGNAQFADPQTHCVSNVALEVKADKDSSKFQLNAYLNNPNGPLIDSVDFDNTFDFITAIDDIFSDVTRVIDADKIRETEEAACENAPIVRMEDKNAGRESISKRLHNTHHKVNAPIVKMEDKNAGRKPISKRLLDVYRKIEKNGNGPEKAQAPVSVKPKGHEYGNAIGE